MVRVIIGIVIGWLLLAAAGVLALTTVGDSATSTIPYVLVWLVTTTLPGVLIWRALARPTTFVQEIGFGSVLGIAVLLLAWLPATLLQQPWLMWLLPAGTVAVLAAVPSLRSRWRTRRAPELRTPGRWHVAMMAVGAIAFARLYVTVLDIWRLPPTPTSTIFQDAWNEMSLTQALTRTVAIDDPAAAGVPLHYHWFSNAHAAAIQQLSGASTAENLLHLWPVMMLLTFVLVTAAATERILQGPSARARVRWWAGPLAALLAAALPAVFFLSVPRVPGIDNGFNVSSTSGILALVVVLAFVGPVLDLLHGVGRGGTWLILVLLIGLSAGAKPSILPVVACGGLLVTLVEWVRTRTFPRIPALLTVLPLAMIPLAALAVIGSTGGSRPQLFEVLGLDPAFRDLAGEALGLPGHGGWLAPGLADGPPQIWRVAFGLLLLFVFAELPRLIGLVSVFSSELRSDPAVWWCAGVVGSGFVVLWSLSHPGFSQHYFWRIVIALGIVMTVTMVLRLLPDRPRTWVVPVAVVALAGIATAVYFTIRNPVPDPTEPLPPIADYAVRGRLMPYVAALVVLLVIGWIVRRRWVRADRPRLPVAVIVAVFLCAAGATTAAGGVAWSVRHHDGLAAVNVHNVRYVSADEQRAALWLNANSRADDVLATNVFCLRARYRPNCYHTAFWIAGLSGRQQFVGSWAYTEQSMAAYGRSDAIDYRRRPSPWPDRVALSLAAVRSPNAAVIGELRRRGVTWIFADRRATKISPKLKDLTQLRYENGDVQIYRIAPAP